MVTMKPSEFERHAGMASCKSWRFSILVDDGSTAPQRMGAWLEAQGLLPALKRYCVPRAFALLCAPLMSAQSCTCPRWLVEDCFGECHVAAWAARGR
jgi:hypothetical protein